MDFFSKGFLKMKVRFLGSNRSTDRAAAPMYFKRQFFLSRTWIWRLMTRGMMKILGVLKVVWNLLNVCVSS